MSKLNSTRGSSSVRTRHRGHPSHGRRNLLRTSPNRTSKRSVYLCVRNLPVLERELAFFCTREAGDETAALHYLHLPRQGFHAGSHFIFRHAEGSGRAGE